MAETPILNEKILEDKEQGGKDFFSPSETEQEVVRKVFTRFREIADSRNLSFDFFDGRDLIQYINDNVESFITNVSERDGIDDWQARVHDPFTRNKVIAILGKVSKAMPKAEFIAKGAEDFQREQILSDLLEHADRVDDTDELMFYAMLEAIVKGTVIGYEGYEEKERAVRDVVKYDGATKIKLKKGRIIVKKVVGHIVPLEDFYPSSVGIRKIKDMPDCAWRSVVTIEAFKMDFAGFEKAEHVLPFQTSELKDENRPFYLDYISGEVPEGHVEIIRYYNQDTDEFVIIANGIWLNPLIIKETEEVMPIPFAHKSLPFWSSIYEPLGDFFYGKALPDKLKSLQDVTDTLYNMLLDQSFLSIFPPILTGGPDDIEDDFLRPGRRISVSDPNDYKELVISTPKGWHQFILGWTKRQMEEASVDATQQGISGTGDRVTATEIERAAQSALAILGLFAGFIKWGVRDKTRLRAKNILQFYKFPLTERILGEDGTKEYKKAFNTFKIQDTTLTSGKRGIKIIEMFRKKEEMPTKEEQKMKAKIEEKERGVKVERLAISMEYIRDFEFDIILAVNPQPEVSKALEKALVLEKARVYLEFMPELIDKEELAAQIARAFGDKPEKVLRKDIFNPTPEGGKFPGAGNMGVGQNLIKGIGGQQGAGAGVKQLLQQG